MSSLDVVWIGTFAAHVVHAWRMPRPGMAVNKTLRASINHDRARPAWPQADIRITSLPGNSVSARAPDGAPSSIAAASAATPASAIAA